ncbi:MAG TPA: SEC-C metal-binding domain-containing protein [Longimicrobium sp.]|nr:SEC-C metal-binding domain-containing protein [Longimicrobium sp.]
MSRPNRNEPCPCGSGKKYKQCCQFRDRAVERLLRLAGEPATGGGEAPWDAAVRAAEVWEADVVPVNIRFSDAPDASPALATVVAAGFVVHGDVVQHRPVGVAARARAVADVVQAAARIMGVLPPALHVRDAALAERLGPELAPRGIRVAAAPMPELDEAIVESLQHLLKDDPAAGRVTSPDCWAETEASPAELAGFHAAAAAFFRARPWERKDDDEPLALLYDDDLPPMVAVVMGGAGIDFGLALYSEMDDFASLQVGSEDAYEHLRRMRGWAVTASYEDRRRLSRAMQREVAGAGWEVASSDAYPMVLGLRLPEFRVTARHVRMLTRSMVAVTAALCGPAAVAELADPRVEVFGAEPRRTIWEVPAELHPIGPEGPNADPRAALRGRWAAFDPMDLDRIFRAEDARVERFAAWLETQPLSKAARRRHARNARSWSSAVAGNAATAAAATEYDLRDYLYDWFPRKSMAAKDVKKALPDSLRAFFAWLAAHEGIHYPWAPSVLDEFERVRDERDPAPDGMFWEEEVMDWRSELWDDLDARVMLPDADLPGTEDGWPGEMNGEVAELREELQRLWLVWYDEVVRAGTREPEAVRALLLARQRAWEATPHAGLDGRTPRDAVLQQEADPPAPNPLFERA